MKRPKNQSFWSKIKKLLGDSHPPFTRSRPVPWPDHLPRPQDTLGRTVAETLDQVRDLSRQIAELKALQTLEASLAARSDVETAPACLARTLPALFDRVEALQAACRRTGTRLGVWEAVEMLAGSVDDETVKELASVRGDGVDGRVDDGVQNTGPDRESQEQSAASAEKGDNYPGDANADAIYSRVLRELLPQVGVIVGDAEIAGWTTAQRLAAVVWADAWHEFIDGRRFDAPTHRPEYLPPSLADCVEGRS